ncbi:Maf family protein [Staphylospora marina]|uniref:Maf family protein n=1 Tax=Staphylospora marina TaxID=2490858 RepID=UPI000F5BE35D|nr:Maf family protein [Staphylospora marina]
MRPELVLASGSPRRRELLSGLGLSFRVMTSQADEELGRPMKPEEAVEELALRKARAVASQCVDALVIGADTVVVHERELLGKPKDASHAADMLRKLSGHTHQVVSGIALVLVEDGAVKREIAGHRVTEVTMRRLSERHIDWYVGTGEPLDKAGAYGIQGKAACFIEKINGDYFNVVGMSPALLDELMERMGFMMVRDFAKARD